VDGKWRVLRDLAIKSTSQVRVNGDLSEAFPLSAGVGQGDPHLRCCSISLSMTSWLTDTCSEHGICMGQTDVASLMRTMRMHYPSPQWLAKLMDYIHTWLNKWRMRNFTKSKVMVFHPKEGEFAACRRRTAGTPGH
jgi:hypothetical protein